MSCPKNYCSKINGCYYYFDADDRAEAKQEVKKILKEKGFKQKDVQSIIRNYDYYAYNVYRNAIGGLAANLRNFRSIITPQAKIRASDCTPEHKLNYAA